MASLAELRGLVTLNNRAFMSKMRRMRRRARMWGRQMQRAGALAARAMRQAARATAALGLALAVAFREGYKFKQGMAEVSTMLGENQGMLKGMTDGIREMSAEFGMAKDRLTKGLYDILSAGIPAAGAMDVLEVATKGAVGGVTDTAVSVDLLTTVLNAYSKDASEAAHISDVMFKIVKEGKVTYAELAENIGKIAPTAHAAGMTIEELGATIATLVKVEKPERAMTALRAAMMTLAKSGKTVKETVKGLAGANLQTIMEAGFSKRAAAGIAILAGNIDVLNREYKEFGNVAGVAQEAFERMDKVRQVEKVWQSLRASLSLVGEMLVDGLTPAIEAVTRKINEFRKSGDLVKWAATAAFAINDFVMHARIGFTQVVEYAKAAWAQLKDTALIVWDKMVIGFREAVIKIMDEAGKLASNLLSALGPVGEFIENVLLYQIRKLEKALTAYFIKQEGMGFVEATGRAAVERGSLLGEDDVLDVQAAVHKEQQSIRQAIKDANAETRKNLAERVEAVATGYGQAIFVIGKKTVDIKKQHKAIEEQILAIQRRALGLEGQGNKWAELKARAAALQARAQAIMAKARKDEEQGAKTGNRLKGILLIPKMLMKSLGGPQSAVGRKLARRKADINRKLLERQVKLQETIAENTGRVTPGLIW